MAGFRCCDKPRDHPIYDGHANGHDRRSVAIGGRVRQGRHFTPNDRWPAARIRSAALKSVFSVDVDAWSSPYKHFLTGS
jgi:hypothetical protein